MAKAPEAGSPTGGRRKAPHTESPAKKKSPEGYMKTTTAIGVAVVCLAVGLFAGSLLFGRAAAPSRNPAPPTASEPSAIEDAFPQSVDIEGLKEQTRLSPGKAEAWTELGNAYFDTNQYLPAIEAYRESLQIDPRNPDVWTDLGVMYRRSSQPQKALEAFGKATQIDPKHEKSLYNKGVVLMHDMKDIAGARQAWESLARIDPEFKTQTGQTIRELLKNLP
jgi:cytochrome c-type biogenesis protein CcmH/NrfG